MKSAVACGWADSGNRDLARSTKPVPDSMSCRQRESGQGKTFQALIPGKHPDNFVHSAQRRTHVNIQLSQIHNPNLIPTPKVKSSPSYTTATQSPPFQRVDQTKREEVKSRPDSMAPWQLLGKTFKHMQHIHSMGQFQSNR